MKRGHLINAELEVFLGIACLSRGERAKIMKTITPAKRALYDRMATVEHEVELWQAGLGPKPTGVIVCHEHKRRRR